MEVHDTEVYCRSLLGLQSPTLNFLDLIQNSGKCCKNIITSCGLHGYGHEKEFLLTINERFKCRTLYTSILFKIYTSVVHNNPLVREIIKDIGLMGKRPIIIHMLLNSYHHIIYCT